MIASGIVFSPDANALAITNLIDYMNICLKLFFVPHL